MTEQERIQRILDEQNFPYLFMTLEERDFCLNILKNCKDICDSNYKVDGEGKCELLQLSLKKNDNVISANGIMRIGRENRCINADIFLKPNKIIVDSNITRLIENENGNVEAKSYTVLDEFAIENNKLKRRSQYNYDMKSLYDEIENEEMKGKLK